MMTFRITGFTTEDLYRAYQRITALLDARVLPGSLQDGLYAFSTVMLNELYSRADYDETVHHVHGPEGSRANIAGTPEPTSTPEADAST
jgi:hypothetical protein